MPFAQRFPEDPGTPLARVSFCVVDLETTGGSPRSCAVTEIGAIRVRRGEVVGSFQTLVDPGEPVPAFVRLLTGITNEMLIEAPPIAAVLPSLLEFLASDVIVAHNARFDVSFLDAALGANGYEPLRNRVIDTALLARKMLAGEVPNHKLETLAAYLRCPHRPCHRAFADVLATTDVLHHLIERAAGFGVTTLEDLVAMSATRIDGTFAKIELCRELPRGPGVYRFLGSSGQTLYVGKAADIRSRVRSYFYGDPRRRMRDLLRETQRIEAEAHPSTLEAEVAEVRAIARELPPYNRAGKRPGAWYVKIDHRARVPRVCSVRAPKEDRAVYLGPVSSLRAARLLMESFRDALRLHRCTDPARCSGCAFSQMGTCPGADLDLHRDAIRRLATAVGYEPDIVLAPLRKRMCTLSGHERFEEAAEVRTRASLLGSVLRARAETQALLDARALAITDGLRAWLIKHGQLAAAADASDARSLIAASYRRDGFVPVGSFWPPGPYREARVISTWLRRNASRLRILHVEGSWTLPVGAGDAFRHTASSGRLDTHAVVKRPLGGVGG